MTYEKFAGGNALDHNVDIAIYMGINGKITEKIDDHDRQVGNEIKIVLKKTKVNNKAHQGVVVPFLFETGWDSFRDVWTKAIECNVIEKFGGGYFQCDLFPEEGKKMERRIRGEKTAIEWFKEDKTRIEQLQELINKSGAPNEPAEENTEESTE